MAQQADNAGIQRAIAAAEQKKADDDRSRNRTEEQIIAGYIALAQRNLKRKLTPEEEKEVRDAFAGAKKSREALEKGFEELNKKGVKFASGAIGGRGAFADNDKE